jgi:hypothetical protein
MGLVMLEEMVQEHQRRLIEKVVEVVVQEQQELRDQVVLRVVQVKVLHLYLVQPLNLFILLMDVTKVLLRVVCLVVVEQEDKIHKDFRHQEFLDQQVNTLVVLEEVVMHVLNQDLEIVVLILVIQEQLIVVVEVEQVLIQMVQDLLLVDQEELVVQVMF